jgi:hypothetical protein
MIRLFAFAAIFSAFAWADTWTGSLVDAKCFAAAERNVNPTDTLTFVDRNGGEEVRSCAPTHKTKLFALVPSVGDALELDGTGNAKALELLKSAGKTNWIEVVITGEPAAKGIKVDSLSLKP